MRPYLISEHCHAPCSTHLLVKEAPVGTATAADKAAGKLTHALCSPVAQSRGHHSRGA